MIPNNFINLTITKGKNSAQIFKDTSGLTIKINKNNKCIYIKKNLTDLDKALESFNKLVDKHLPPAECTTEEHK